MPRYHFNTTNGGHDEDREGADYDSDGAACVAAIRYAGDLISDSPDMVMSGHDFRVEVTDDASATLFWVVTRIERDGETTKPP